MLQHYMSLIQQKAADIRLKLAHNLTLILLVLIGLLIGSSMVMIAYQSAATRKLAATTSHLSENTNHIVKSQTEILNAIKKVTDDTRLTAEQQTTIIICMLQVQVEQRTTDTEKGCRESAATFDYTSSNTAQAASSTSAASGKRTSVGASSKSKPKTHTSQPTNSQPAPKPLLNCRIDILGIHLWCHTVSTNGHSTRKVE